MAWHFSVLQWLIHAAVGGCVFLGLGCLAVRFCRQPVRRLRLIELTLLGSLLVPWLSQLPVLPHWSLGWLTFAAPTLDESPATPSETLAFEPGGASPSPNTRPALLAVNPVEPVAKSHAFAPVAPTPASAEPAATAPSSGAGVDAPLVAVLVYGAAVFGFLVWWLAGIVQLVRLHRSTYPVPQPTADLFRAMAGPAGERVKLLASDRINLPLTFSSWRPVIVLPGDLCKEGDSPALRYCLAHEWSHVEQRDAWRWYLATLAQFFFFYQPLFWWLRRQLRLCQDYLADARAAEQAPEAEDYAEYLVGLARRRLGAPAALALGIGDGRSNLYRRIIMLLQSREPLERRCLGRWNLGISLAAVALLGAVAVFRLDAGTPEEKKDSPAKEEPKKEEPKKQEPKSEALHYTGRVFDKDTDKGIPGATVTVRRSLYGDPEVKEHNQIVEETKHKTDADGKYTFTIPPEQVAKRYLYIELDVEAPGYAPRSHFGYALSMILKNEKIGGRPFFENVDMRAAKEITGVVKTPDGKPAAGVKILAYSNTDKRDVFEYGSFADCKTDKDGAFRLWLITPGPAVFWILPEKYAPSTHGLKGDKRGDLGTYTLQEGITFKGTVLDAKGKPLAGVNVNAEPTERNEEIPNIPVADAIRRSCMSNDKGEFEMAPLPPGTYQVKPDEWVADSTKEDRKKHPVPAVFLGKKITLKNGEKPELLEVRAVPHVVIEAQYIDTKGKHTRGHECFIFGQLDGLNWFGQGKADADGHIVAQIPHGLENVQVDLMTNEHGVLRHRMKKDEPLSNKRKLMLGTVNDDVKGIEIIRYTAPILLVKVTPIDGTKPAKIAVTADYEDGKGQHEGKLTPIDGLPSDVFFEKQEDGRFRSSQLLPDEEVTVIAHADGYESKPMKLKLPEGESKEIELVLEKAPEKKDK
jgi:beta-lactamase regulating signal transducer with metallopeptidase domain/protocatechuate 3,4-dioxygenase beta subunit